MTDTIDDVAAKAAGQEPVEPAIDEQGVAEQLVAQAREKGIEPVGPEGLLSQLTKRVLETALEAEMSDHLGYDMDARSAATVPTPATGCDPRRCFSLRAVRCHARMREISSSKGNSCDYRPAQQSPPGHCCGCSAIHNRFGRLRPHPKPIVIVLTGRQRQSRADLLGDAGETHRLHPSVL